MSLCCQLPIKRQGQEGSWSRASSGLLPRVCFQQLYYLRRAHHDIPPFNLHDPVLCPQNSETLPTISFKIFCHFKRNQVPFQLLPLLSFPIFCLASPGSPPVLLSLHLPVLGISHTHAHTNCSYGMCSYVSGFFYVMFSSGSSTLQHISSAPHSLSWLSSEPLCEQEHIEYSWVSWRAFGSLLGIFVLSCIFETYHSVKTRNSCIQFYNLQSTFLHIQPLDHYASTPKCCSHLRVSQWRDPTQLSGSSVQAPF